MERTPKAGLATDSSAVSASVDPSAIAHELDGFSAAHELERSVVADDDVSRYCPVCSQRLESRRCKLICPVCGYYMSCADYY